MTAARWLDRLLLLLAVVLAAGIGAAAWLDASQAWDVWYYHLPFAARLFGIVDGASFVFSPMNTGRYGGFPLGGEILQGLFWRVTGRPEAANLVAFLAVPLFALLLARKFGARWHHVLIALFAIPLVQTHATSCYVDLPANACAAGLVLLVARRYERTDDVTNWNELAGTLALAAGAAFMRFQLAPLVVIALIALFFRERAHGRIGVAIGLPVVFLWPLKNLVRFKNPVFPVELRLGPIVFPGLDTPYEASPVWLEHVPRPVRFAISVFEVGARPLSDSRRWTVDQWTPPDHDGYRMGGFFGAYVAFLLVVLAWSTWRTRGSLDRAARARLFAFGVVTAIVAMLPQSHELRYYLVWMILLVATTLLAVPERARVPLAAACATFLFAVVFVTRGAYVRPSGDGFDALVSRRVDATLIEQGRQRGRVCVARPPWNFLHAARFHAQSDARPYVVVEADSDAECPAP